MLLEDALDADELAVLESDGLLAFAASRGFVRGVKCLLAAGFSPDDAFARSQGAYSTGTALHFVYARRLWALAGELVAAGADPFLCSPGILACPCCLRGSVFEYAASQGPLAGFEALLAAIDYEIPLDEWVRAFWMCLERGSPAHLRLLLARVSDAELRWHARAAVARFDPLRDAVGPWFGDDGRHEYMAVLLERNVWSFGEVADALEHEHNMFREQLRRHKERRAINDNSDDDDDLARVHRGHKSMCDVLQGQLKFLGRQVLIDTAIGLSGSSLPVLCILAIVDAITETDLAPTSAWNIAKTVHLKAQQQQQQQ